jgi:hypothetical protein
MSPEDKSKPRIIKYAQVRVESGQPISISDESDSSDPFPDDPLGAAVSLTLKAYREAAKELVATKFSADRERVPVQWRRPCDIWVISCPDGIIVRYDEIALGGEPKVRHVVWPKPLRDTASGWSAETVYFPDNIESFIPPELGPGFILQKSDAAGSRQDFLQLRPRVVAPTQLPPGFTVPAPPAPPPRLVSISSEFRVQMHGVLTDSTPIGAVKPPEDHFIADSPLKLLSGWLAFEVYPILPVDHWRPEYAHLWADIELTNSVAQSMAREAELIKIDGATTRRDECARMLQEFEELLRGDREEPVHQFLKRHPLLLSPTHDCFWSKEEFGGHISDFVFREPHNDYVLVEIEAPHKELFRKDGQQRAELTTPINQIADWLTYIQDNRQRLETEQGLTAISTSPRMLVVIGRSLGLTEGNRKKLQALESMHPRLRIRTYDEILTDAQNIFRQTLGPVSALVATNAKVYWFRPAPAE